MGRFSRFAFLVFISCLQFAEALEPENLTSRVQKPESIEWLPAHVVAPAGEITLFADYNDVRGYGVVLYLINRTHRRIGFHAQDGDVYAKLEVQLPSGEWERAQRHYPSDCGNSYDYAPSLRPDEFFRFLGSYPSEGETSKVRYRIYSNSAYTLASETPELHVRPGSGAQATPIRIISNEGQGRVSHGLIEQARVDSMALNFGSFNTVRDRALGITPADDMSSFARAVAIRELKRFPDVQTANLLAVLADEPDQEIKGAAIQTLAIIGEKCPEAEARDQELLNNGDISHRAAAISSLAERSMSPAILNELGDLMEQSNLQIRAAAISALARSCNDYPEIHAILMRHNYEPDAALREFVQNAQERRLGWCCHPAEAVKNP